MNDSPSDFLRSDLRPCDSLDDYLAGALSLDGRSEFENHLEGCPSCLDAVDEWRELCQALRTATTQLEVPSRSLLKRIESRI
jgi:anti-sigma factor RsiW